MSDALFITFIALWLLLVVIMAVEVCNNTIALWLAWKNNTRKQKNPKEHDNEKRDNH